MASTTPWERILKVYEYSGCDSVSEFARSIGLYRAENLFQIKRGKNRIILKLAEMIHAKYRKFSTGWLMTGEGTPFVDGTGQEFHTIPYYTNFSTYNTGKAPDDVIPVSRNFFPDADYATIIKSNWLEPRIPEGSLIMLKNNSRIIYGGHYYVELENGDSFYRIIRKSNMEGSVRLISGNSVYDAIKIPAKEIIAQYMIVGYVNSI